MPKKHAGDPCCVETLGVPAVPSNNDVAIQKVEFSAILLTKRVPGDPVLMR